VRARHATKKRPRDGGEKTRHEAQAARGTPVTRAESSRGSRPQNHEPEHAHGKDRDDGEEAGRVVPVARANVDAIDHPNGR
jgi:hypothetical protein